MGYWEGGCNLHAHDVPWMYFTSFVVPTTPALALKEGSTHTPANICKFEVTTDWSVHLANLDIKSALRGVDNKCEIQRLLIRSRRIPTNRKPSVGSVANILISKIIWHQYNH